MVNLTPDAILEALRPVQDPELRRSLVELNMIRQVQVQPERVTLTLVLTTPACPLREFIVEDCKKAIRNLGFPGEIEVLVTAETPSAPSLPDRQGIPGVRNIVAVSSGKGGVGKTTVAVNLAVALASLGSRVGLLDADIYGPNVPLMLGEEGEVLAVYKDAQGHERVQPLEKFGVKNVSMAFLIGRDQPVVWR
ncbi:MAG: P-loop NTPase, partial [Thermostichales cyanobacterium DRC_bins_46]